ncbi:MAG: type II secretion system protein [Bacilli bacterium]
MKRRNGFTLVELLVVIAVIGLIAGISIPSVLKIKDSINEKALESRKNEILTASELYAQDYVEETGYIADINITVDNLIVNEYIKADKDVSAEVCDVIKYKSGCVINSSDKSVMNDLKIKVTIDALSKKVSASFVK